MFGLFKRKDPICKMKEEKGKGMEKHGEWFCSEQCLGQFETEQKQVQKKVQDEKHAHPKEQKQRGGCC